MSEERWREQRRLAAEFAATARLVLDANIRCSLLALAQKWLDIAEREPDHPNAFNREECFRDVQMKIGKELRAQYHLPQQLSHQMLTLLMQLNTERGSD
jgi:hypothetical protein